MKFLLRFRRGSKSTRPSHSHSQGQGQSQSQSSPKTSKSPRTPKPASTPKSNTYAKQIKYTSPKTPRASGSNSTSTSTAAPTTDVIPPAPPLEPRYTSKINLARCSSLESMDTMISALYLRPSQFGQYDIECPETPRRPKQKSPPRPVLVRTFGPTVLRSNRQYQRQMQRRVKSEKGQTRRSTPTQPTVARSSSVVVPNAAVRAAAVAVAGLVEPEAEVEVEVPSGVGVTVAVQVVDHDSTMPMMDDYDASPPSPVPSNLITPLDLNPADEITGYFPDTSTHSSAITITNDETHQGRSVPDTVDPPQSIKSSGTTRALIALLPSLPTFHPTSSSSPAVSPTGSAFNGNHGPISPSFSNFKFGVDNEFSVSTPRHWDSFFGQSQGKVVRTRSITSGVDSTPSWTTGNVFGESVFCLDSPTSDVPLPPSVFRSSRPTSTRLAERRPIVLDMSTARRRPRHITAPCVPLSSPSSTTTITPVVFKDATTQSFKSPMSPTKKIPFSTAQDSNVIVSLMEQIEIDNKTAIKRA